MFYTFIFVLLVLLALLLHCKISRRTKLNSNSPQYSPKWSPSCFGRRTLRQSSLFGRWIVPHKIMVIRLKPNAQKKMTTTITIMTQADFCCFIRRCVYGDLKWWTMKEHEVMYLCDHLERISKVFTWTPDRHHE